MALETMSATSDLPEVGILVRKLSMLSVVHGLNDLFQIAERLARARSGGDTPVFRVSLFAETVGRLERVDQSGATGEPNIIIVPPLRTVSESMEEDIATSTWLRDRHSAGVTVAATCGGVFLLAQSGLLDGRQATTHWACAGQLAHSFPSIDVDADQLIIDDGDLITGGGMLAWADLALIVVDRLLGRAAMLETARYMMIDPPGRQQRLYRIFSPELNHGDLAVSLAQDRLHLQGPHGVSISDMAGWAHLEMRTFVRRFHKATGFRPNEYSQRLRVDAAREKLEGTTVNVNQIAFDVGYGDPASFRKVFTRIIGVSPGDYRKRHRQSHTRPASGSS